MSSNSKLYKKYLDAKKKLARLKTSTLISVVVNVNSNPLQTTTLPASQLTKASTINDHSPILVRQIHFDQFDEIRESTRGTGVLGTDNEESIDIQDTDNEEECIDASLSENNL